MFTGIVEGIGLIKKVEKFPNHARIHLRSSFSLRGTKLGDSIAVDGCCLTVTRIGGNEFSADLSPETLSCTTLGMVKVGGMVNLERPLKVGDRLGGHFVQGHVDGVGKLIARRPMGAKKEYLLLTVRVPKHLKTYMVEKGSVTIDGISLTVNEVNGETISVCIIPHTLIRTALTRKKQGARVNIEADFMIKYLENLVPRDLAAKPRRKK